MKLKSRVIMATGLGISMLLAVSCTTTPKADLESQTPQKAITDITEMRNDLQKKHYDLVAPDEFNSGEEKLAEASEELNDNNSTEAMNLSAQAKTHFMKVEKEAASKTDQLPQNIIDVRSRVLSSKIQSFDNLRSELAEIDENLIDETDAFAEDLSPEEFSELQKSYLDLQVRAVQKEYLRLARTVVERSEENDADDKAPRTFKTAQTDLTAAENLIQSNVSRPKSFQASVDKANKSAKHLNDVMAAIRRMGDDTSEKVALELVAKDRKIGKLSDNITDLEQDLDVTTAYAGQVTRTAARQSQKLDEKSKKISFQQAIDEMSKKFDKDEAEVYQQGQNLIIRLKQIDFETASAELPGDSMDLLAKVGEVVGQLNAQSVEVQGHTDARGETSFNKDLSNKRATAVANYLKSTEVDVDVMAKGFGESKPLATNETQKGRRLNRRVDVVVFGNESAL